MPQSPDFPDATANALVVVLDIAHGRESMTLPGSIQARNHLGLDGVEWSARPGSFRMEWRYVASGHED